MSGGSLEVEVRCAVCPWRWTPPEGSDLEAAWLAGNAEAAKHRDAAGHVTQVSGKVTWCVLPDPDPRVINEGSKSWMELRAPALGVADALAVDSWLCSLAEKLEVHHEVYGPSDADRNIARMNQATALRIAASTLFFAAGLDPRNHTAFWTTSRRS